MTYDGEFVIEGTQVFHISDPSQPERSLCGHGWGTPRFPREHECRRPCKGCARANLAKAYQLRDLLIRKGRYGRFPTLAVFRCRSDPDLSTQRISQ